MALLLIRFTPLHEAVYNSRLECAKLLLDNCANINQASNIGSTPIFSIETENIHLADLIIKNGADTSIVNMVRLLYKIYFLI